MEIAGALGRIHDHRQGVEITQRHPGLIEPGVAGRQGRHQGLGHDPQLVELRPVQGRADQTQVDAPGQQGLDLFARHHFPEGQINGWQTLARQLDQPGQEAVARSGRESDRHPSRLAAGDPPRRQGR
ncbi:hypothetical protein D3C71_1444010 [compost metagenome]